MEAIKKIVVINDLSGVGRCSLTAALPIISCIGVQCCPFPTAILSNQTNYKDYFFKDITNSMPEYMEKFNKLSVDIHGIYSGFLGSEKQIDIVLQFINSRKEAIVIVDPVMGDNGEIYNTYTNAMCEKMKMLVNKANIITPNLTEACILLDKDIKAKYSKEDIKEMLVELSKFGPSQILITGVVESNKIYNYTYDKTTEEFNIISSDYNGKYYSGTGDIISSIISGEVIKGVDFYSAVKKAIKFINKAIKFTENFNTDTNEGVMFEGVLGELINYEQ